MASDEATTLRRMRLLLAKPRGYCAGVEMALASLEKALEVYGTPLYVFHEIVHNKFLIEAYQRRGVKFVNDLKDVPAGATVIYSAHGVSPEIRNEAATRELNVIDATCPLVSKVHFEARHFTSEGYTTIFIGHRGHDETLGVLGEGPNNVLIVESVEDIAGLELQDDERTAFLTQTTLSVEETAKIVETLRERFPHIRGPREDDICYATQNRQEAVRRLAAEADVALVIGSRNSSNSQRLAEVARAQGIKAYLIDWPDQIDPQWIVEASTVLLTAGASVPEELVVRTIDWLKNHFELVIEERVVREEEQHFQIPVQLRV